LTDTKYTRLVSEAVFIPDFYPIKPGIESTAIDSIVNYLNLLGTFSLGVSFRVLSGALRYFIPKTDIYCKA